MSVSIVIASGVSESQQSLSASLFLKGRPCAATLPCRLSHSQSPGPLNHSPSRVLGP